MKLFLVWCSRPYEDCETLVMIATSEEIAQKYAAELQVVLNNEARKLAERYAGEGGTVEVLPADPPAPPPKSFFESLGNFLMLGRPRAGARIRYEKKDRQVFGTVALDVGVRTEEFLTDIEGGKLDD